MPGQSRFQISSSLDKVLHSIQVSRICALEDLCDSINLGRGLQTILWTAVIAGALFHRFLLCEYCFIHAGIWS